MKKNVFLFFFLIMFVLNGSCILDVGIGSDNVINVSDTSRLKLKFANYSCLDTYTKNYKLQPKSFPLIVYLNSDSLSNEQAIVAIEAMQNYNDEFNFTLFTPVISNREIDRKQCGTIWIVSKELTNNYIGYTFWNSCSAKIEINVENLEFNVFRHELGHALNLFHEKDPTSVMYRELLKDQQFSNLTKCLVELSIEDFKSKNVKEFSSFLKEQALQNHEDMLSFVDGKHTCSTK